MAVQIGMVLFPRLTQLDLTAPHEILARIPDVEVHLIAKTMDPVASETGLTILPTTTFKTAPAIDLLFAPGGAGQIEAADDDETLDWLTETGARARWVTSTCTGSLLLGCAGLLRGYRASTHWVFMDLLPMFGAIPTNRRVVIDRNRMTSGGVTAGIDIALHIAAELAGREVAERIQLALEYDPEPPFRSGHPNVATPELVGLVREKMRTRYLQRKAQIERLAGVGRPA